jgi:hypothetical protein
MLIVAVIHWLGHIALSLVMTTRFPHSNGLFASTWQLLELIFFYVIIYLTIVVRCLSFQRAQKYDSGSRRLLHIICVVWVMFVTSCYQSKMMRSVLRKTCANKKKFLQYSVC